MSDANLLPESPNPDPSGQEGGQLSPGDHSPGHQCVSVSASAAAPAATAAALKAHTCGEDDGTEIQAR